MRTPGLLPLEGTAKSGRKRIVSLDDGTIVVLRNQHKMQTVDRLKVGPEWRDDDGLRLHDRLGRGRPPHATALLLAGVPVHVVAARLGRADPSITLRVYAHMIRAAEASAADVSAQAIGE
ncbi:hypothetical protein [Streptosporangium sp. NPDC003464]